VRGAIYDVSVFMKSCTSGEGGGGQPRGDYGLKNAAKPDSRDRPRGHETLAVLQQRRGNSDSTRPGPPSGSPSFLNLKSDARWECGGGAAWRVHGGKTAGASLLEGRYPPGHTGRRIGTGPEGVRAPVPALIKSWIFQGKGVKHPCRRLL
jgi:hypothetical protein